MNEGRLGHSWYAWPLVEIKSSSDRLFSGQSGLLLVRARRQNMGSFLYSRFTDYIEKNNFRTHGL